MGSTLDTTYASQRGTTHAASKPLNQRIASFDAETNRMRWVRACLTALSASAWAPALNIGGLDLGEACLSEAYLELRQLSSARPERVERLPLRHRWNQLRDPARIAASLVSRIRGRLWSVKPMPSEIVFHAVDPTHLAQQVPVAQRLVEQGSTVCFITARQRIIELLSSKGIRGVLTGTAWKNQLVASSRAGIQASSLLGTDPGVALPTQDFLLATPEQLLAAFRACLRRLLPAAHQAIRTAELVLEEMRPKVVVIGNDVTLEGRILTRVARRSGVPTASLMHGTVHGALHDHHIADQLLVFGEAHRRTLEQSHGVPSGRVSVCGAPYLDAAPPQRFEMHRGLRRKLGLPRGRRFVLMAVSNPANLVTAQQHELTIRNVMRLSERIPDVTFVARLHKADSAAHYSRIKTDVPGSRLVVVPQDASGFPTDILDWLQGCSALLTGASAVATEAMLLDVPVVTMDFTEDYREVDFIAAGATRHVTDAESLFQTVSGLLNSDVERNASRERSQRYLDDYFFSRDRRSAARCASVLRTMATRLDEEARCAASRA